MTASSANKLRWSDRMFRQGVLGALAGLQRGQLTIRDAAGANAYGTDGDLAAAVTVHDARFYRRLALDGSLGAAESYLEGEWDADDLTAVVRILVRNLANLNRLDGGWNRLAGFAARLFHRGNANTKNGSKKNIRAHYDLGNEFFKLWLDDTMAYSSAIFRDRTDPLGVASTEKFDRVCRKLDLQRDDRLVEIGSGWGGFALHAAGRYGANVTTTTISDEQFAEATRRIAASGLSHRVEIQKTDYRDLRGQFDKLASIEMIEAVGHRYLDDYFRCCSNLLKSDGTMVLQAIVMPESRYDAYLRSVDFIQRYVFPGSCLVSVAAMLQSVGRATDLRLVHLEDLAPHYAETLRRWNAAFHARLDDVRRLGYPERFVRLWRFYLCYCEAIFEERHIGVVQIQFDKPGCRRDPIDIGRWAAERRDPAPLLERNA